MSNSNGLITAPVTMSDINKVLGISTRKLDVACRHNNINKWSIVKPIAAATNGERLTHDLFRGSFAENSAGVYWGLYASCGYRWDDIHLADWSYIKRPTGIIGVAPCRGLDFDGYDHYARPCLYGKIITPFAGKIIYTHTTPFELRLTWNYYNNGTGVDPLSCYYEGTEPDRWYLCVAIDGMMAVMRDANNNLLELFPLTQGEQTYKCPTLPASLRIYNDNRRISFFIAALANSRLEEMDRLLDGEWVPFPVGYRADIQAITIPEAVGYSYEFTVSAVDYGTPSIDSVRYDSTQAAVIVRIGFEPKPPQDTYYRMYFYMQDTGDRGLTFDLYGGTGKGITVTIPKSQLGVREGTFAYSIVLYGYANNVQTDNALTADVGEITII